jgi:hypothetical protein
MGTADGGTRDGASSAPHVHVVRLDVTRRALFYGMTTEKY